MSKRELDLALHSVTLTDGSKPCICSLYAVWLCAWRNIDAHHQYPRGRGGGFRSPTAKSPSFSLRFCGPNGGSPLKIHTIGCVIGLPWPWHAVYRWGKMVSPAFQAHRNSANVGRRVVHHCPKRFSYSARLSAIRHLLIGARDLIIDSAPILAWRRADPDAADCACSSSASSPTHAQLSRPHLDVSRFRITTLFSAFSCQCSLCSISSDMGRAFVSDPHALYSRSMLPIGVEARSPGLMPLMARSGSHSPSTPNARKIAPAFHPRRPREELGLPQW